MRNAGRLIPELEVSTVRTSLGEVHTCLPECGANIVRSLVPISGLQLSEGRRAFKVCQQVIKGLRSLYL